MGIDGNPFLAVGRPFFRIQVHQLRIYNVLPQVHSQLVIQGDISPVEPESMQIPPYVSSMRLRVEGMPAPGSPEKNRSLKFKSLAGSNPLALAFSAKYRL